MLRPKECLRIRGEIIAFGKLHNNRLIYSLRHKMLKAFSLENCQHTASHSLEYINSSTTAIDFHRALNLVAIANGKTIYIYDFKNNMILQNIIVYGAEVMCLHFVQNTPYIIVGTTQGRVMQYRYDAKSSLSRLCSFPFNNPHGTRVLGRNYISTIDSYEHLVAASGYGGAITIIDIHAHAHKRTIQKARLRIDLIKFVSANLLIATTANSNIHFHHLDTHKEFKSISSPLGRIHTIELIPNTHFALIAGESNAIALLDLEKEKIFSSHIIIFDAFVRFFKLVNNETIVAVLDDNTIQTVLLPSRVHLKELIKTKEYAKAFRLIRDNPILKETPEHEQLEKLYSNLYSKALKALIASNKRGAFQLLSQFESLPEKKKDVQNLLKTFEFYQRFNAAYIDKRYNLAYSLCEQYPALQHTYQYRKMEKAFQTAFTFAQKQILMGRYDVARDTLYPFKTVKSKKELIKLLLGQNKEFVEFLKALQNNDYKTIETLTKHYSTFATLPNYRELLEHLDEQIETIHKHIYEGDVALAIDEIKELQSVTLVKEQLKDLYTLALQAQEILDYYETNQFKEAYELLDRYQIYSQLALAKLMQKHWQKLIEDAEELALKGNLQGIKKIFGELLFVTTRSAKTGDILRLCFQTKIRYLLSKRSFKNAEIFLYKYIDIFGIDTECRSLMQTFEKMARKKLAITHNQEQFKARDAWMQNITII